jgi:hypothetical protein
MSTLIHKHPIAISLALAALALAAVNAAAEACFMSWWLPLI